MDQKILSSLLQPYLAHPLDASQLAAISGYLDLLMKWNSKMNLTAVRQPEEMVTRHFGESLFAAQVLASRLQEHSTLLDLGSGAGFPGLPIKIALPELQITLAESQHKKSTFLKEVVRSLAASAVDVYAGRAEDLRRQFDVVTMRAVDGQEKLLLTASRLISSRGLLLLMVGTLGVQSTKTALPEFTWQEPVKIPASAARWILVGTPQTKSAS